jgi:protein-S-isoprenylcysteine O-methyltransferase Ste14
MRFTSLAGQLGGSIILLVGLAMLVVAGGLFKQADTDLIPFRDVRALVTTGVYRFTRNPMYLGMALVLLGCAVVVGAVTALMVPVVFVAIIQYRFILPEEQMLRELFPEGFPTYCRQVRRWI